MSVPYVYSFFYLLKSIVICLLPKMNEWMNLFLIWLSSKYSKLAKNLLKQNTVVLCLFQRLKLCGGTYKFKLNTFFWAAYQRPPVRYWFTIYRKSKPLCKLQKSYLPTTRVNTVISIPYSFNSLLGICYHGIHIEISIQEWKSETKLSAFIYSGTVLFKIIQEWKYELSCLLF